MQAGWAWGGVMAIALGACRGADGASGFESIDVEMDAGLGPEPSGQGSAGSNAPEGGAPPFSEPVTEAPIGGAPEASSDCYAEPVTLEQLHAGRVRSGIAVSLGELQATSQKFLLSEAKSGSCLWGAFVADPERS